MKAMLRASLFAAALVAGSAAYDKSWYGSTAHPNPLFRSVSEFGAKGDGVTDDTAAIQAAIDAQRGDTNAKSFAVVYFPCTAVNVYVVSDTLVMWMGTEFRGCSTSAPTLRLPPNAAGFTKASALRPMIATTAGYDEPTSEKDWWSNSLASNCIFYNMISNLVLDAAVGNAGAVGLYWCVAQQTSLRNLTFLMGDGAVAIDVCVSAGYPNSAGGGNGGGGTIEDIVVQGGNMAFRADSSQWAIRGMRFDGQRNASVVLQDMIWSFAFVDIAVSNTPAFLRTGASMDTASSTVAVIDAVFSNITGPSVISLSGAGSPIFLQNVRVAGPIPPAWVANATSVWLTTDTAVVTRWAGWAGDGPSNGLFVGGVQQPSASAFLPGAPAHALASRPRPWFDALEPAPCNAVTDCGANGLNATDDTAPLQKCIDRCTAVFLPGGAYAISDTLNLTSSTILIGEMLSAIYLVAGAPGFNDSTTPRPMLSTPDDSSGTTMLMSLSLIAGADNTGAELLLWRVGERSGLWDVNGNISHNIMTGFHFAGSGGGFVSNSWVWGADHSYWSMEPLTQDHAEVGVLISSHSWLTFIGLMSEHHFEAMLRLDGARSVDLVTFQTEQAVDTHATGLNETVHIDLRNGASNVTLYGALSCNWWQPPSLHLAVANGVGSGVSIIGYRARGSPNAIVEQPSSPGIGMPTDGGWLSLLADIDIPSA